MHVKHVSNATFYQMSDKYHENKCRNVHHLHGHMPRVTTDFPTTQCTGSPCTWNHWAVAAWDTRSHSARPGLWPPNSPDLNPVGGDRRRGNGSFGVNFGASHCNQWEVAALLCSSA